MGVRPETYIKNQGTASLGHFAFKVCLRGPNYKVLRIPVSAVALHISYASIAQLSVYHLAVCVCVCVCVYFLLGGAGPIVVPTPLETYVANRYVPHSALRPCPD